MCFWGVGGSGITDYISKCETSGFGLDGGELAWLDVALFLWLKLPRELPSAMLVSFAPAQVFLFRNAHVVKKTGNLGFLKKNPHCSSVDNFNHVSLQNR